MFTMTKAQKLMMMTMCGIWFGLEIYQVYLMRSTRRN
jgi:hypothetical protein